MKAIILISSIFYILGLKLGNKIDLVKDNEPTPKVITNKINTNKLEECSESCPESTKKIECDTVKGGISYHDALLKSKVF